MATVLIGLALSIGYAGSGSAASDTDEDRTVTVVVRPGQTLWGIAGQIDAGADRQSMIRPSWSATPWRSPEITPGQHLVVPTR